MRPVLSRAALVETIFCLPTILCFRKVTAGIWSALRRLVFISTGHGGDHVSRGVIIELFDKDGKLVERLEPESVVKQAPVFTPSTPVTDAASREGVTFHCQPCGSYIATAGAKRVCGVPYDPVWARELVAGVMLSWITWEKRRG